MFSQPPKHHPLKMTIIPSTLKKTKKKNISLLKTKYTRLIHQTQSINHSHSNNKSTVQIKFNNYKNKTKINPKKKNQQPSSFHTKTRGKSGKQKKKKAHQRITGEEEFQRRRRRRRDQQQQQRKKKSKEERKEQQKGGKEEEKEEEASEH